MKTSLPARLAALPPRTLLLAMGGVLLLLALEGWLLALRAPWTEYAQARQARAEQAAQPIDRAALRAEAVRLEAELAGLKTRLQASGVRQPREELVADMAERLSPLGPAHDVRLVGIRPAAPRRAGEFEELPVDLQLTGRYRALADWLRDAERTIGPLVVTRFAIQSGEPSGLLRMELRLAAHRPVDALENRK